MMTNLFRTMKDDTSGATAVEYGLIVSLIVVAVIVGFQSVAAVTNEMWQYVETESLDAMGA